MQIVWLLRTGGGPLGVFGLFYGLAADRQEYCFTKDFFLFYFFIIIIFFKVFFEPKPLFF